MHVFAGANAQGKTNLLEAVYFAATGHSPRTHQEHELIAWEADVARVVADFSSTQRGTFTVEASLGRKLTPEGRRATGVSKRWKVNETPRQLADLAGLVPVVLFLVDDLDIIRGEPARRRSFLDTDLAAMSRTYAWALRQYTRVIEQRNRVLKDLRDGHAAREDLLPWNEQLATFGGRLLEVRTRFIADINTVSGTVYQGLTGSPQQLAVTYLRDGDEGQTAPATREAFATGLRDALDAAHAEEIRRGSSLVGPHRDELRFTVDARDVRQFGSQGEQRTAALALRVAEFTLLHRLLGEPPVMLLDDILSELDRTRRGALLDHLAPVAQVIVTTTDIDAIGLPAHGHVRLYQVARGEVKSEE